MEKGEWVRITTVSGMTEAQIVKGRLEADGITVCLKYDIAGVIYGLTVNGLGEVQILVPEEEERQARQALGQTFDDRDLTWETPGEGYDD
ncbi:MAG: DUF2007 domain-containing protein [Syntrophales bacterium]|nr:DUF2007 domain-containing protein [Syntrophales bacterium]